MFLDLVIMNRFVLSGLSEPWFRMQSVGSGLRGKYWWLYMIVYWNMLVVMLPCGLGGAACRSLPSGGGPLHPAAATSYIPVLVHI